MDEWDELTASIGGMVQFLKEESIFDAQRLPSYPATFVIAALWEHLPKNPDELGNAWYLLRKYLWRAFLTSRYEQSSSTHALQDFRGLRNILRGDGSESDVPVFNERSYPLPTQQDILEAYWPRRRTILGQGLLALQLKCGAEDIADGKRATVDSITSADEPREYHHLFPQSLLAEAGVDGGLINCAANCALISWRSNRVISDKDPVEYLKDRADNSSLGEEELRQRLRTHLIPYEALNVGDYAQLPEDVRGERVTHDYLAFLDARAELLGRAARLACDGRRFDVNEVFDGEN